MTQPTPQTTNSHDAERSSAGASGAATVVYCIRSGVPLATITPLCSMGMALVPAHSLSCLHPIYGLTMDALLARARKLLADQEAGCYMLSAAETKELSLCMSAIMYAIEAIWEPPAAAIHKHTPSLPSGAVTIASAARLLVLSNWYWYLTTKRVTFPLYRVSKTADNLEWQNFSAWLDDAFAVRATWATKKEEMEQAALLAARSAALVSIKEENIYKRIDVVKVWNWIDVQLAVDSKKRYPGGRRETLKTIFMHAEINPQDWVLDDVEDLQMAILECCDLGNDISFFINRRIDSIRAAVKDFYSSFTMLDRVRHDGSGVGSADAHSVDMLATPQEQAMQDEYDARAAAISELPPAPQRASFASLALYLKASAQHNILARRFAARGK